MPRNLTIQLARTATEFEAAFRLLRQARDRAGFAGGGQGDLWLLKHHALPSSNTIVALEDGKVVGAICLFGESAFRLPVETHLDLHAFRRNLEGRLAELSLPGLSADRDADLLFGLYYFATCFGTSYCHHEGFVTEAPVAWTQSYSADLRFKRIYEPVEGRQLLFLDARNEPLDYRAHVGKDTRIEYVFPEKKFFLVAHQSLQPSVLNYLFNERTKLFSELTDRDLRVLQNVYDWGEHAKLLPKRDLQLPEKKTPRFPRFPMNCEGYLVAEDGSREHAQLLDVSREGLKLRLSHHPETGASYVLTLFIGVNKKTELIAQTVWVDPKAEIAGFELRSSDACWAQLLEYLEKDYLKVA